MVPVVVHAARNISLQPTVPPRALSNAGAPRPSSPACACRRRRRRAVGARSRCCGRRPDAPWLRTSWPMAFRARDTSLPAQHLLRAMRDRAATGGACARGRRPGARSSPYSVTPSTIVNTVLMIVRPPGEPVISTSLPSLTHHRRRHRAEHPLARRDEVGGVPMSPVGLVSPGFLLKSPISLLRRKPAPLTTTCEPKPPSSV